MTDQTFELYKLMVEEVRDAKRARRELSNVFMTLNLAGVGALGFLASGDSGLDPGLFAWCAFALALTCVIWRTSNSYYIVLLAAKYKEVYELEAKLGATPLRDEYATVQGKRSIAKWFSLERAMPLLFIVGYAVFFAVQAGGGGFEGLWEQARALVSGLIARFRS
ncbi:hypothetical protein [Terricaulis sp.]|uniref:RipA family octameric membrane protein n=1 Tax=Terricaulis sp. TaxID=2768686 RepID=UPI00378304DC